ncbi:MAG: TolC family protein [Campylobacterales bacterium]
MKLATLLCATLLGFGTANASDGTLNLNEALDTLKKQNLELKAAQYDVKSAEESASQAWGQHWGSLDFIQNFSRSDDALNVFGFKLTSREATFGDFGFAQFDNTNPGILDVAPEDLNYPEERNFFQSKLEYTLPLYVGGKISAYVEAAEEMERLKKLDKTKLLNEKIYETRKAYYDMRLLDEALANLKTILGNIETLEKMTQSMIQEGYAKQTDLLEVQAKKSNVTRSIHQMEANEDLLYHYLSFLLNQPVTSIALPDSDVPMPQLETAQIIENNIDVKRARTGLKIRESMKDVAMADYLPMVGMQDRAAGRQDPYRDQIARLRDRRACKRAGPCQRDLRQLRRTLPRTAGFHERRRHQTVAAARNGPCTARSDEQTHRTGLRP